MLYYPLSHFVCSQEMFHHTVTSPLFHQLDLGRLTLLNECCHMKFSHFGPWSWKLLRTLLNPCVRMCSFRNRRFQQLQGTGSWAKIFYISPALMTYLRTQWASHTKWWKRTKALWKYCCAVLLAGCVCYGRYWGKKGLIIQTGTLLLSFLSLGLTSGKMEINGDSEPSQIRVEKTWRRKRKE